MEVDDNDLRAMLESIHAEAFVSLRNVRQLHVRMCPV